MSNIGNKETMAKNLSYYLERSGKTQKEVSEIVGVATSTFNDWMKAKKYPRIDKVEMLADYFGILKSDLIEEHNDYDLKNIKNIDSIFPITIKKFPLLGEISCGEPILANEDRESYILSGTDIDADFCLKAKGDSMIGARIHDGDIVFIKKADVVNNGEVAAVIIDDEVLLKRFYYFKDENLLTLQSENPKYPPKNYVNEQLNHIRVIGKAIAFQSDVR